MSDHVPDEHPRHQPTTDGPAEVDIPAPRSPVDDLPEIGVPPRDRDNSRFGHGLVEPDFQYDQTWKRGKRRRYRGYVERANSAENGPSRETLAAAVRDLLDWASQHADEQSTKDSDEDGDSR